MSFLSLSIYLMPQIFTADKTKAVYMAEPVADILAVTFTVILFAHSLKRHLLKYPVEIWGKKRYNRECNRVRGGKPSRIGVI